MHGTFRVIVPLVGLLLQGSIENAAAGDPVAAPAIVPSGLSAADWWSIQAAHEARIHQVEAVAGGHQARNPGQRWTTCFDGRGFLATPDAGSWSWGLELTHYGWEAVPRPAIDPVAVHSEGGRLTYAWDGDLSEWYVNDRRGLEHGFTVRARPADAEGPLHLELRIRGDLAPVTSADGRDVRFVDRDGVTQLTYAKLTVFDADGRDVPACWLAAGERLRLRVDETEARYPLTIDPIAQQAILSTTHVDKTDWFGDSVAISGDTVVVGVQNEDSSATGVNGDPTDNSADVAGAAYVFVRNGTGWSQQAYLKASNADEGDIFGTAVAISGDTIAIGAPRESSAATGVNGNQQDETAWDSGAVYVFVRSGSTWTQQAYIKASNTGKNDFFGDSVALSGDVLVVGAPFEASASTGVNGEQDDDPYYYGVGAAYVFARTGTTWSQEAYLKSNILSRWFGTSVAASGDSVIIGCIETSADVQNAGAAYVFVRNENGWATQARLQASNLGTNDGFGSRVAISGDTAVVGSYGEDSAATGVNGDQTSNGAKDSGAAYVFVRQGTAWTQQAYLKASNTGAMDVFGYSVAIDGDALVVGAGNEDSSGTGVNGVQDELGNNRGAAYLFVRHGGTWSQQAYLKGSQTYTEFLGASAAISGDTVIAGAPANHQGVGHVYVFTAPCGAAVTYGAGCAGSGGFVPALAGTGCASGNGTFAIALTQALGGSPALLLIAPTATAAPVGAGCTLLVGPAPVVSVPLPLGGSGPGNGSITVQALLPASITGQPVALQMAVADPAKPIGFVLSNGVQFQVE